MELKVWVDNIQRIVCGVTEATTCQDVVYALAHATSQTGRFTLVEKWRSNERILSPSDKPLKVLLKWGEYSGDVQFVLRRSTNSNETQRNEENSDLKSPYFSPQRLLNNSRENVKSPVLCNNKEIKKSLTFSGGRSGASTPSDLLSSSSSRPDAVVNSIQNTRVEPPLYKDHRSREDLPRGVVRGIPQQKPPSVPPEVMNHEKETDQMMISRTNKKIGPPPEYRIPPPRQQSPINVREPPKRNFHSPPEYSHNGNGIGTVSPILYSHNISSPTSLVVSNVNGPISSPSEVSKKRNVPAYPKDHKDKSHDIIASPNNHVRGNGNAPLPPERTKASQDKVYKRTQNDPQYMELLRVVNSQREKISSLDSELKKYDSEIKFWEENNRKQEQQSQLVEIEIKRLEFSELEQAELITQLDTKQIDKKLESGQKQEQSLKNEISLIRSDVKSKDKEMISYQEKVDALSSAIKEEKERMNEEMKEKEVKEIELRNQINEVKEKIKEQISHFDENSESCESVEKELLKLEDELENKKKEMEDLIGDMKAVNLESLTLGTTDDSKSEGTNHTRSGSARKIVGSPRELENAVPTSKNPHGVWV